MLEGIRGAPYLLDEILCLTPLLFVGGVDKLEDSL